MKAIEGGITAPKGYRAAGFAARIKPSSTKRDCALIVSDVQASVAGVFTTNRVKAAPVVYDQAIVQRGHARAVFVNSGNANACTGDRGLKDAHTTAAQTAQALDCQPDEVLVCSTGVIGLHLPMDRICQGIAGCVNDLSASGSPAAAEAIMTTDTVPKERAVEFELSTGTVRVGGIAKGAGMIAPNMATLLAFITTDAGIEPGVLSEALHEAAEVSFNRICVDNDMSTNDTLLAFANGKAGAAVARGSDDYERFRGALSQLCIDLAKDLVRDGEGATKLVEIRVDGAVSNDDAKRAAFAIATSQLCKTAFHGEDPNWGRISCAAGYSGAVIDPAELNVYVGDVQVMKDGGAADYREEDAAAVMKQDEFAITVRVGQGSGAATYWTSDLSKEYVSINADYRS